MSDLEREWWLAMRRQFGELPVNYGITDVETTGFTPDDVIVQLGQALVQGTKLIDVDSVYVNWIGYNGITEEWLRGRIEATTASMAEKGAVYKVRMSHILQHGRPPQEVFRVFLDKLQALERNNYGLTGHNVQQFDMPKIAKHTQELFGIVPVYPADLVFDSGAIAKGRQLLMTPQRDELLAEWCRRSLAVRATGVYWKLDGYCADTYDLWRKSGLDPAASHDAGDDCRLTYHLVESYRELMG